MTRRDPAKIIGLRQKSEDWLQLAAKGSELGLWYWDEVRQKLDWDSKTREMFGAPPDGKVSLQTFIDALHPDDRDRVMRHWRHCVENGLPYSIDLRVVRGDGSVRWINARGKAHYGKQGKPPYMVGVVFDVTERKREEQAVRESEDRFRSVADTAPVLIWMSGTDKLCTYFNKPWLDFTGRSIGEELGNGWAEGVHLEDLQRCLDTYTQAFDRREKFRMEYRLRRHDGEYRWILDIGVPRLNQDGSFSGYIGIGVDVTERKLVENRLREYERAVEAAEEMIAVLDREYRILIANRRFATMRNMQPEQVVGRFASEVLNKEVFEGVIKPRLDECFQGKVVRYEMKYTYPELGERDLSLSYFPIEGATGVEGAACIAQDITESKRAEEALRNSEERFRLGAQAGKMYAYTWDMASDVIVRAGDVAGVLGSTGEVSLTREQLLARVHPDDRASFNASVSERTPEHPDVQISYRVLRPDGSVAWVEKTGRALFDNDGRIVRSSRHHGAQAG